MDMDEDNDDMNDDDGDDADEKEEEHVAEKLAAQQPDDEAIEQHKRSIEQKQVAQTELEANRRELRELRAHMDELQHKWNAHLLQTQREEAKVEQEREQKQQEEAVRTTLPLGRWQMAVGRLCSYTADYRAVGAGASRAACKAATPGDCRI